MKNTRSIGIGTVSSGSGNPRAARWKFPFCSEHEFPLVGFRECHMNWALLSHREYRSPDFRRTVPCVIFSYPFIFYHKPPHQSPILFCHSRIMLRRTYQFDTLRRFLPPVSKLCYPYRKQRQFSVISINSSFPASLLRYNSGQKSNLFDHKKRGNDDAADDGVEVASDGLVYPTVSKNMPCLYTIPLRGQFVYNL